MNPPASIPDSSRHLESQALCVFWMSLAGNALGAYDLQSVPVPWLTNALVVAFVPYLVLRTDQRIRVPGLRLVFLFGFWSVGVTLVNISLTDYSLLSPELMTTSYPVFIILRFLNILAFLGQLCLTFWLVERGYVERLIRITVSLGTIVAMVAVYVYVAQVLNLPELPRNRIGTGGGEQSIQFTYAFHRAMGTFREPSHLAEWLATPLVLSFLGLSERRILPSALMGLVLLLTGSLTGILGVALGLAIAVVVGSLGGAFFARVVKLAGQIGVLLVICYPLFFLVGVSYSDGHADLIGVLTDRIAPLVFGGGVAASNRDYVYQFVASTPIPWFGLGMGNCNLVFSDYFGISFVTSYLSLYINTLYATGYLGLLLLSSFLFVPILRYWRARGRHDSWRRTLLLGAYCSWLVVFAVHAEELTAMFGVIYAMAVCPLASPARARAVAVPCPGLTGIRRRESPLCEF